ncbi:MAG: response regulator [bacterium]|nr:response regulator [bacterium]
MKKPKILLIDDESVIREELEIYLRRKGYDVVTGVNGLDGFYLFQSDSPDLVLTDYRMPKMNGIAALQKMKAANPDVPVIMLSGQADMKVCVQALNDDAYEFIEKPVDLKKLLGVIQRALDGKPAWWNVEN